MCRALSLSALMLLVPVVVHAQTAAPAPADPAPSTTTPAPAAKTAQPEEDPYLSNYKKFEHRDERAPGRGPMGKRIGFGLELGRPTAVTTKIFFTQTVAVQVTLGFTYNPWFGPEGDLQGHIIWHPQNLITRESFKLSWYIGGGARFAAWPLIPLGVPSYVPHLNAKTTRPAFVYLPNADSFPGTLGGQFVAGFAVHLNKYPVEIYAQPIVTFDVFPGISADLGAQAGVRWYFF